MSPLNLDVVDEVIADLNQRMIASLLMPGVRLGPAPACLWCRNRDKAIGAGFRCQCGADCGAQSCLGDRR